MCDTVSCAIGLGEGGPDEIDDSVMGTIETYVAECSDTFGGRWSRAGTLVLSFTDDPEVHRSRLLDRRPSVTDLRIVEPSPPIVDFRKLGERQEVSIEFVSARFSQTELEEYRAALVALMADEPSVQSVGIYDPRNRVHIVVSNDGLSRRENDLSRLDSEILSRAPVDAVCVASDTLWS